MKAKHIPNILSVIRILLVPVFVFLYVGEHRYSAVAVFVIAGLTDVVDGYIARKYNFITNVGKVLDPFADKLMQFTALLCLYFNPANPTVHIVPWWMPAIYFLKEITTLIGAIFVFRKVKVVVKSHIFGILATFFVFAFISVIIALPSLIPEDAVKIICALMCAYFVFSNLMYVKLEVREEVKKEKTTEEENTETKQESLT